MSRSWMMGAVLLVSLLSAGVTSAQDLRHRDYFFGDRAMGMAGAFTALASDPSAAYYNPAGLPFGGDKMFAGSLIVVDQQTITLANGLRVHPDGEINRKLESGASGLYPNSGAAVSKLGENQFFTIASFTPINRNVRFSDRGLETVDGSTYSAITQFATTEARRLTGPVYGIAFSKSFSIGIGAFYSRYSFQRSSKTSAFVADELNDAATTWTVLGQSGSSYDTRIETGGLALTLGTLFRTEGGLRIGFVATIPTITLHSTLDLSYQGIQYGDSKLTTVELSGEGTAQEPSPLELRFGLAYEGSRFAVALDLAYFSSFKYFELELPEGFSPTTGFDTALPLNRESRSVINAAIGVEYKITEDWATRLGAFTNRSSSPEIPSIIVNEAYSPQLDEYGFTFGTGYEGEKGQVQISIGMALGSGDMVVRHADRTGILPQRESVESTRVFVALSGAVSFVKSLVKKKKGENEKE